MRDPLCYAVLLSLAIGSSSHALQVHHGTSQPTDTASTADTQSRRSYRSVSSSSSRNAATSDPTCVSRTANYITHTLPQQCLRTDRAVANSTQHGVAQNQSDPDLSGSKDVFSNLSSVLPENSRSASQSWPTLSSTSSSSDSASAATQDPSSSTLSNADSGSSTTASQTAEATDEADSPFDNANFLSFEEWKKQNLAKAGQSPEHVGQGHGQHLEEHRQRPGINNALEALGEEGEIELDFAGFGGVAHPSDLPQPAITADSPSPGQSGPTPQALRSKDAGKTCKERTNYASFDCAATVLKTNPQCKSASSVLVENKDSYMLNPCSADNKFFIVELCNDILIDTVVLANYEFFSSIFRQFRISVSDRYPVKMEKWKHLGTFEARNTREVQAFLVENPLIWARYLRIEFLSHYGSEYYCPLSLLRVHGTTMLEEFRHQEEVSRGEHDDDSAFSLESEATATPPVVQEPEHSTDETAKSTVESIAPINSQGTETSASSETSSAETPASKSTTIETAPSSNASLVQAPHGRNTSVGSHNRTDSIAVGNTTVTPPASPISHGPVNSPSHTAKGDKSSPTTIVSQNREQPSSSGPTQSSSVQNSTAPGKSPSSPHPEPEQTPSEPPNGTVAGVTSMLLSVNSVTAPRTTTPVVVEETTTFSRTEKSLETAVDATSSDPDGNRTRSVVSATSAAPAQPSTQESFFKSIHKRLQQLESNSTLSLQYIEEQSRILRDAFSKVEKRQLSSTSNFLAHLNETVMTELHGFRKAYDQLWQSTVIELEGQREQYQREMLALSTRLTLVADELVWQKRMGIAQSTLLLLCLGLVLFARNSNGTFEMPIYQQMLNRSQSTFIKSSWETPPASPSPQSRSPVSLLRRRIWRSSTEPDSRPETREGVDIDVTPPTPEPQRHLDVEREDFREGPAFTQTTEHEKGHSGTEIEPSAQTRWSNGLDGAPGDQG